MKIITKELIRNCVFGVKCNKKWKSMKHVGTDSNDKVLIDLLLTFRKKTNLENKFRTHNPLLQDTPFCIFHI